MESSCWLCALFYTSLFVGFVWFIILLIQISNKITNMGRKEEQSPAPSTDQDKAPAAPAIDEYRRTRPE